MKKSVLFVFHDTNPLSGATASMLEVIKKIKNYSSYNVTVLMPRASGSLANELNKLEIDYIEESYLNVRHDNRAKEAIVGKAKSLIKIITNLFAAIRVASRNKSFDLIYTNTSDIYVGAFISRLTSANHIWHIREFGIEDQNATHIFGEKLFYRFVNNSSKKVISISHALNSKLKKSGIFEDRLELVYNDVSSPECKHIRLVNHSSPLSMLIVGTISEGKGHKFIVSCVSHLKSVGLDVSLSIVGDDSTKYAKELKSIVKEYGCEENVNFLGYRSDVERIRSEHDIAVVASRCEAFGRVTIEAMHSSLVVVASNSGANPELIEHGYNGFLFQNDSIEDFSNIIMQLDSNRSLIPLVGNRANDSAKVFSVGEASKKINSIIECIISE